MKFGVAQMGLRAPDDQRLRSIIGMLVVAGTVRKEWHMCKPHTADLVVFAPDNPEALAMFNRRSDYPHIRFAALVGSADSAPEGCHKLSWPIRTEDVMRMLVAIESAPAAASTAITLDSDSGLLALAVRLRDTTPEHDPNVVWKVRGTPDCPLFVAPVTRSFYYQQTLARLRCMPATTSLKLETARKQAIPETIHPRPLLGLQWLIGDLLGELGLLPWINPDVPLRLKCWPNFPALVHGPRHRRIAAHLSERPCSVAELAEAVGMDIGIVRSFINAAALCGYLAPAAAPTTAGNANPVNTRPRTASPRASLFSRMRFALGIAGSK